MEIIEVVDPQACRDIWQRMVPPESLFDLWEVRSCFARHYERAPLFLVASRNGSPCGLLALATTDESGGWGCFPGETWNGKTWLERNRVIADSPDVYRALMNRCPPGTHLRYLSAPVVRDEALTVDEVGYLFVAGEWAYSADTFWAAFSGKSRRRHRKELESFVSRGAIVRRDNMEDVDIMFDLNLNAFGDHSYFADPRFIGGFRELVTWLAATGRLGVTAIVIEGHVAAVDVHAVYNNACTVLAGGTHPDFPGVAKLINHHHIEWACRQEFAEVDFLCGDFGWKQRFHLTPRPLYQYHRSPPHEGVDVTLEAAGCGHGT